MYVPSNILKMPSVCLIPDNLTTALVATFSNAASDSNYRSQGLEPNTAWSIDADTSRILILKKTLVRAFIKPQKATDTGSLRYQFAIQDPSTLATIGTQGGFDWLEYFAGGATWPNGGNLSHVHSSADAIVDANTYIRIAVTFRTSSALKGILADASYVALYQLEP